jgi:peptide deformylase
MLLLLCPWRCGAGIAAVIEGVAVQVVVVAVETHEGMCARPIRTSDCDCDCVRGGGC